MVLAWNQRARRPDSARRGRCLEVMNGSAITPRGGIGGPPAQFVEIAFSDAGVAHVSVGAARRHHGIAVSGTDWRAVPRANVADVEERA